jgi:hypothetical protein
MKRCAVVLTMGLLVTGCESMGMNDPFKKKPNAAAKSPDQADYFEIKKDGQTWILGSNSSRDALMNGTPPAAKATPFDNGKTVMVENTDYNQYNRLVAEYKKAKGL